MKNRMTWVWFLVTVVPLLGVGGWAGWNLKADTGPKAAPQMETQVQTEPESAATAKVPFDCCDDPTCPPGCCPECPPDCKPSYTSKCPPCPWCP